MTTREYKIKRIHAVERAVAVLDCLHANPQGMPLRDLHTALRIAKPTLLRILATLRDQQVVWQRLADHAWLGSFRRQRIVSLREPFWLAELASPVLASLASKVPWPSQISIPVSGALQVIESNYSEAFIDPLPPNSIGYRVPILRSASGRAWFCFASADDRETMLEILRRSHLPGDADAKDHAMVTRLIAETTNQGYATRSPLFGGDFNKPKEVADDARDTIALPVCIDGSAVASLNLTWKKPVVERSKVIAMHLDTVRQGVRDIEQQISRFLSQRDVLGK